LEESGVGEKAKSRKRSRGGMEPGNGTNGDSNPNYNDSQATSNADSVPALVTDTDTLVTGIGYPFNSIKAHTTRRLSTPKFTVRQVAFSRDGEWCVACGDGGKLVVLTKRPEVAYRY
jgi:hypothetical protein